uniref:Serine/threonine-protein kinase D1-3-like ubiquitin-like domain-containing protein n=1 Tax=Timema poppense TaxID=170557 RepID=A0A7R9DMR5_TIMPO|nr:unnamed protein product [Timema poppensis]
MEGPEVTFLFQFGLVRDTVTTVTNTLGLKTIKSLACDFINKKHCGEEGTVSSVLQLPGRPCRVNDLAFTFHLTSPGPTSLVFCSRGWLHSPCRESVEQCSLDDSSAPVRCSVDPLKHLRN